MLGLHFDSWKRWTEAEREIFRDLARRNGWALPPWAKDTPARADTRLDGSDRLPDEGMSHAEMRRAMRDLWKRPRHDSAERTAAQAAEERADGAGMTQAQMAEAMRNAWRR